MPSRCPTGPARPKSPPDLFFAFTVLALQGFGGVLPVVQQELVERKQWLTREEFLEDWAVAQLMPGPNVVNISLMIGARHFGLRGALTALAGMLAAPSLLLLGLALVYARFATHPGVVGALPAHGRGCRRLGGRHRPETGQRAASTIRSGSGRVWDWQLACFTAIALLHWPLP